MRKTLLILPLLFCLGCISAATRDAIKTKESEVYSLKMQLGSIDKTNTDALAKLNSQYQAAMVQLDALRQDAVREKRESKATIVGTAESVVQNIAPIASIFVPVLGGLLGAIGAGLGSMKTNLTTKKEG